jgi:hypothetical protein
MEDICSVCRSTLATVQFSCGHRCTCRSCHDEWQRRNNHRASCPLCRTQITGTRDATSIQGCPATLQSEIQFPRETYPFGALLLGTERIANENLLQVIQEAVEATQAGLLTYNAFRNALSDLLTATQREMALVYLHRNIDFAEVVKNLQLLQFPQTPLFFSHLFNTTVQGTDGQAIFLRAIVQTAFNVGTAVANGGVDSLKQFTPADGVTSFLVLAIFAAVEVYRYSSGLLSLADFRKNLGEHVCGTLGSLGASYLLATSADTLGGPFGVFIAAVMSAALSDAFCRGAYRLLFPSDKELRERSVEPFAIAQKAARHLNIDFDHHTFSEAQGRYRNYLYSCLPERNPDASPEMLANLEENRRKAIASWALVRQHYRSNASPEEIAAVEEGFVIANVLKIYDHVSKKWKIIRTWFGDLQYVPREGESVATMTFHF